MKTFNKLIKNNFPCRKNFPNMGKVNTIKNRTSYINILLHCRLQHMAQRLDILLR